MSIIREGGWENDTAPTIRTLKHDWRILNDESELPDIELDESAHALVNTSMSLLSSHGTRATLSSLNIRHCPECTSIVIKMDLQNTRNHLT